MYTYDINNINIKMNFKEAFLNLDNIEAKSIIIKELKKRVLFQHYFEKRLINAEKFDLKPENLLKNFCEKFNLTTSESFKNHLINIKKTREEFLAKLVYDEKIQVLKEITVTDQSINNLFIEKKTKQESVLFGLIRVKEKSIAKEIYYRLTHDHQDFGELSEQYSTGSESKHNGIIGPVNLQNLNPDIKSRLIIMKEGQLSYPFSIDGNEFLIVKLIRIDLLTLNNQFKNLLRDELFDIWTDKQLNQIDLQV